MRIILFIILLATFSQALNAQWTTSGTTVYHNGNVGINTTNPTFPLHVQAYNNTGSVGTYLWSEGYGTAVGVGHVSPSMYAFAVYGNFDAAGSPMAGYKSLMYVRGDGNVGLGTETPNDKLTINGNVNLMGNYPKMQMSDRAIWQMPIDVPNSYTRSFVGQNLVWNPSSNKWVIPDPVYPDFGMIRFENSGVIGLYNGVKSSGQPELTNLELGEYKRMTIGNDGSIGIGTDPLEGYRLAVNGAGIFTKIKVKTYANWPDFVFNERYHLMPIRELEQYITQNKHLPGIASATEVEKGGVDIADNQAMLLQKIEELTLYIIQQQKRIEALEKRISK